MLLHHKQDVGVDVHAVQAARVQLADRLERLLARLALAQIVVAPGQLRLDVHAPGEAAPAKRRVNAHRLFAQRQLHEALRQEQVLHPVLWQDLKYPTNKADIVDILVQLYSESYTGSFFLNRVLQVVIKTTKMIAFV